MKTFRELNKYAAEILLPQLERQAGIVEEKHYTFTELIDQGYTFKEANRITKQQQKA